MGEPTTPEDLDARLEELHRSLESAPTVVNDPDAVSRTRGALVAAARCWLGAG
ncbi:MAG TPA: hypothetical protein PLP61_05830 [Nocardioides sp.]|uniref:hypothetical protein n=1 Tax=Nocardioides sp. TaxID=35761 RepID=UPI002D01EBC7|nr:hypothetical protein [Nocardioides sp.]HQR26542.1 hypothetical protein [Nocardioides sp.]